MVDILRVVHILPEASFFGGGPSRSVPALCNSLARTGAVEIDLIAGVRRGERLNSTVDDQVKLTVFQPRTRLSSSIGLEGRRAIRDAFAASDVDVVHLHGLWHPLLHWAIRIARRRGAQVAMSPRGTLEPWSLAWKSCKKRLALRAYQGRDLKHVDYFFATSQQEADSIRNLGLRQPIAVVPNGVTMPGDATPPRSPLRTEQRVLLFLSRIHPKKGLTELLHAWKTTPNEGWILKIAGPDSDGHLPEVLQLIERLKIGDTVSYVGPVSDQKKPDLFRESDCFILPSYSENFGLVVAEALSFGLPIITTTGTPWESVHENRCGWWVEPSTDALSMALVELFTLDDESLAELGANALSLATRFSWDEVARATVSAYLAQDTFRTVRRPH